METDRAVYLALAELARRYDDGRTRCTDQLSRYELRCFSQHGEDGVLAELLNRVGSVNDYFVEFGIESGREGNCVYLADVRDWSGLFIEPNAASFSCLERKYAANLRVQTLRAAVSADNVLELFAAQGVPREPDILSIDVDGADYWIWRAVETGMYHPRIVVVEYNAAIPVNARLVQPKDRPEAWDGTDYFGASLRAVVELGEHKGYRFVHTDMSAANAFFVRADLADGLFPPSAAAPRRGEPNYFMSGYHHPRNEGNVPYVDPELG